MLLLQCFYYRGFTLSDEVKKPNDSTGAPNEQTALLGSEGSNGNASPNAITFPSESASSSRRSSSTIREHLSSLDGTRLSPATPLHNPQRDTAAMAAHPAVHKGRSVLQSILFNLTAVLVVCGAGVLGWYLSNSGVAKSSRHSHHEHHHGHHMDRHDEEAPLQFDTLGQVFGYICAVLYLGSRLPQLLLNYRRKSTEGISMLFFLFACIGNATYVLSILAYEPSCRRAISRHAGCAPDEASELYGTYMLVNLSWLIGSAGTLVLDFFVFVQYFWYRDQKANEEAIVD